MFEKLAKQAIKCQKFLHKNVIESQQSHRSPLDTPKVELNGSAIRHDKCNETEHNLGLGANNFHIFTHSWRIDSQLKGILNRFRGKIAFEAVHPMPHCPCPVSDQRNVTESTQIGTDHREPLDAPIYQINDACDKSLMSARRAGLY